MKCVNHANEKHKKDYLGNESGGSVVEDSTLTLAINDEKNAKENQEDGENDTVNHYHWSSLAIAHAIRDGRIVALAELIGVEAISTAFGHHSFPISVGRKSSTTTVVPFGQLSLALELLDVLFFLNALVSHLDGVGNECGKFFIFHNISFPFV